MDERKAKRPPEKSKRRPYEKPSTLGTAAFERRSLACNALNVEGPPFGGCDLSS